MMIVMKTMINCDDDNDADSNDNDDDDQTINFQIFFHTFIYEF